MKKIITGVGLFIALYISVTFNSGCAQIGSPTGGVKDTLAPVLIRASPELKALNFKGNKITLTFNEYVEVLDVQNNVLVSPLQKNNPAVNYSLKTVTIKLKDSLLPNSTYSIQFGNAIKDINEGNVFPNFTYVFSTGNTIDSFGLTGKVLLAETGMADSTIQVLLYRNIQDTAVQKLKPDYLAKLKGDGSFAFYHLPAGSFKLYALKDGDGNKYYNSKTELFAFMDSIISISEQTPDVTLYAYEEEKPKDIKSIRILKPALEKKLRYNSNLTGLQDLLTNLELTFNNPLKYVDSNLVLTDTNFNKIPGGQPLLDSSGKIISFQPVWKPGEPYMLILAKDAVKDSAGTSLAKNDTLKFFAKKETDYGKISIRFKNYQQSKNPVLQFISNQTVQFSYPLSGAVWNNNRFPPGEYELRILYDDNKDGFWTPGNYPKKLQPEKAITLPQKLSIRADWDNERDIQL
jgi:hypothetical protein